MRTLLLIFLFGFLRELCAQTNISLSNADKKEIRFLAREAVATNLLGLFNTLTFEDANASELREAVRDSYLPSNSQIFYDDATPIEDDITPANTALGRGKEMRVDTYLSNLSSTAFYLKTPNESIEFSEILVSDVSIVSGHPFVKVFFKSHFKGEHISKKPYSPVLRVAEIRAELEGKKWTVYITRIAYYKEEINTTNEPKVDTTQVVSKVEKPLPHNESKVDITQIALKVKEMPSTIEKSQEVSPTTTTTKESVKSQSPLINKGEEQRSQAFETTKPTTTTLPSFPTVSIEDNTVQSIKYRRKGRTWLVFSTLALAGTAATYFSLKNTYNDYKTTATADYDLWRSLSRDPSLTKSNTLMSFTTFARPGIYGVYGGGAFSLLSLNISLNRFKKSKKYK